MPAVDVHGLQVRYGSTVAVAGIDLAVEAGEVMALLGPNGAGKTSTVEVLEGYRRASAGEVRVLGLRPESDGASLRPRIGVMLQGGGVYPGMGPGAALRLFASYYPNPEEPDALVDLVGLGHVVRTPWKRLSGGERQRLSLALAIIGRPEVAFLDEPTAGVDPEGRRVIRSVVDRLRQAGAAVLLTTHELEEAERMADRITILDRGAVRAAGRVADLVAEGPEVLRWSSIPGTDVSDLAVRLGAEVVEIEPGTYQVDQSGAEAVAAVAGWLAEKGHPLHDLRSGGQTLEETYFRLTGPAPEPPG